MPPVKIQVNVSSYYGMAVCVDSDEGHWGEVQDALEQVEGELLSMIEAEWDAYVKDMEED